MARDKLNAAKLEEAGRQAGRRLLVLWESCFNRKTLSKVLIARGSVTPEMSVRLKLAFGKPSADHWLRLQNAYDLWQTRQQKEFLYVSPHNFQPA